MRWVRHTREKRNSFSEFWWENLEEKTALVRPRRKWEAKPRQSVNCVILTGEYACADDFEVRLRDLTDCVKD